MIIDQRVLIVGKSSDQDCPLQSALTFGVIAGLKHVKLMGVVGKSEHFDH